VTELPQPARRLAALALLALAPLLAWSLLAAPWSAARDALAARLDDALAAEARAAAVAARGPALAAEAEALRRALSDAAELLPGGSYALAGAELQRRLREAAGRHGGSVSSVETLPEGRAGDGLVGVRARLQTDPAGLRNLLAELETGRALLQVQSLALSPAAAAAGRAAGGQPQRQVLDVQVELRGLRRGEAGR
jgi:hypothetical protein